MTDVLEPVRIGSGSTGAQSSRTRGTKSSDLPDGESSKESDERPHRGAVDVREDQGKDEELENKSIILAML